MDKRSGYWTEAPSTATFDIVESYALEHPELKAGFSRSTGGLDVDLIVAVYANDLRAARAALKTSREDAFDEAAGVAESLFGDGPSYDYDGGAAKDGWNQAVTKIAETIRYIPSQPQKGEK